MKITLKSQRGSDLLTLETEDRSIQFDDFCLDAGPWGYAMLVLLRGSEAAAIIGAAPSDAESHSVTTLPAEWVARTESRWGLASDTPIIRWCISRFPFWLKLAALIRAVPMSLAIVCLQIPGPMLLLRVT